MTFTLSASKPVGSAASCSTENHCGFCFSNLINKNNSSVADAFQNGFSPSQLTVEEIHYKLQRAKQKTKKNRQNKASDVVGRVYLRKLVAKVLHSHLYTLFHVLNKKKKKGVGMSRSRREQGEEKESVLL